MTRASGKGGRGAHLLSWLTRPPERAWPDAVVFHGARTSILILVAVVVTLLFPPVARMQMARYEVGIVADQDVIAQIPFGVPKPEAELERERQEAAAAVPPTFDHRPEAADSMAARLTLFFARVDSAGRTDGVRGVERVLANAGIVTSPSQVRLLTDSAAVTLLRRTALRVAREVLPLGVVDASDAPLLTTDQVALRQNGEVERFVSRDEILTGREFYDRALGLLPASASPDLAQLLRLVLIRFLEPSYVLNVVATELDRDAARRAVGTIQASILAGEAIVRANQQIGPNELERLLAYERQLRTQGLLEDRGTELLPFAGAGLVNLMLLGIFGLLVFFFRSDVYSNVRWVLLLALLSLAYFGVAGLVAAHGFPRELLPIAFVALAVAVLWGGRMALVLVLVLAMVTAVQPPFTGYGVAVTTVVGGAAAALSVRAVRRRAQTWVFIAIIVAAYGAAILGQALVVPRDPGVLFMSLTWAAVNATGSAILAMGFLPVFEWFTDITTDQTLLEWADPNRPLLKRLSLEAPGTYAHTINVANLAEAAANGIGANGLLCRVGVYYHDIGKMLKPQYYVENQPAGRNPHDKLKPDTSAAIVREHVVDGLRLAREAGVPEAIAAFIPEHHGTQTIGFFYDRAREEGSGEPDPHQFAYPGPRPRSRETAIAMLADSVESATRALQDPTPERIRSLIDGLTDAKIREGQLDEAPLTFAELTVVKEQFAKVVESMYHHRIDYPTTRHLTDAPGGPPPPPQAGAVGS